MLSRKVFKIGSIYYDSTLAAGGVLEYNNANVHELLTTYGSTIFHIL